MLDQMSGGRFEMGVGRGVSPFEVGFYGVNHADGPRQFPEALQLIKQGLASDELTFSGEFYSFKNVPMLLRPVQGPFPPIWYGVLSPEAAYWAASEKANFVTLVPPEPARAIIQRYKLEWAKFGWAEGELPLMGVTRHVVLAETTAAALGIAERAYRRWVKHMELLWVQNGTKLPLGLPPEIGPLLVARAAFAGTASDFKGYLQDQISSTGANYFLCDVAFGDLTSAESMQTVKLLGEEVLPDFAR